MKMEIKDVVNILRHAPKRGLSDTQIANRLNLKSADMENLQSELAIAVRNGTLHFDGKLYTLSECVTAESSAENAHESPATEPQPSQFTAPSPALLFAKYSDGSFAIMCGDSAINLTPAETRKLRRFLRS